MLSCHGIQSMHGTALSPPIHYRGQLWCDIWPSMVTHTRKQQWTHTWSSGQPFMLRHPGSSWGFGALLKGTSPWYWSAVHSLPQLHFLLAWDLNSQPFDYESGSLTIRPRLPLWYVICAVVCDRLIKHQSYVARECDTRTKSCHHLSSSLNSKLIWICNCSAIRLGGGIRSLACLYVFPPLSLSIPLSRKCRSVKQSVAMVTG